MREMEDNSIVVANKIDHRMQEIGWFDPISSVEVANSLLAAENQVLGRDSNSSNSSMLASVSLTQKRPRGRPKRIVQSLPEPLFVPSTPSTSQLVAIETWNTAKVLGVKSSNEKAVISALRKSKRLLVLEENNPTGSSSN